MKFSKKQISSIVSALLGALLFCAAAWVIHREAKSYQFSDAVREFRKLSEFQFVLAFIFAALSYFVLTLYDFMAFRYIQKKISYFKNALAAFVGFAFSYSLPVPLLVSASVRYRFYSVWGFSAVEITHVQAFNSFTFLLGFFSLAGAFLLFNPLPIPPYLNLSPFYLQALGLLFFIVTLSIIIVGFTVRKPFRIFKWELAAPQRPLLALQFMISCLDWFLSGIVLFVLLPDTAGVSLSLFTATYLLAQVLGMISNVPAGLGVFEATLLFFLSSRISTPQLLGAMLAYRIIYYLFPLIAAAVILGLFEIFHRRQMVLAIARWIGRLAGR